LPVRQSNGFNMPGVAEAQLELLAYADSAPVVSVFSGAAAAGGAGMDVSVGEFAANCESFVSPDL